MSSADMHPDSRKKLALALADYLMTPSIKKVSESLEDLKKGQLREVYERCLELISKEPYLKREELRLELQKIGNQLGYDPSCGSRRQLLVWLYSLKQTLQEALNLPCPSYSIKPAPIIED